MKNRSRGFTLPELMVVLGLAAAILGIGVPNFREFQRNNRLTVAANDVLGLVLSSRSEALRRQTVVSMCPSADPQDDDATCSDGSGWIAFEDTNADCERDAGEELISGMRVDDDVTAQANTGCVSFVASGFKRVVGGEPTTTHMLYCDERGNSPRNTGTDNSTARGIEVSPTGRGQVIKSVTEIESWAGNGGVSCQ
jgi:type IV fimbrial biogenesis protein FimT